MIAPAARPTWCASCGRAIDAGTATYDGARCLTCGPGGGNDGR